LVTREEREQGSADAAMAEAGKPRVVVVGGGIGGALLAKTMEPDADVVLLDP
jgi:choline dehydrogenase-like flavoprotein